MPFYCYLQVDIPKAPAVGLVLDEVSLALGIFYTFTFIGSFLMENGLRLFVSSFHPLLPFLRVRTQKYLKICHCGWN